MHASWRWDRNIGSAHCFDDGRCVMCARRHLPVNYISWDVTHNWIRYYVHDIIAVEHRLIKAKSTNLKAAQCRADTHTDVANDRNQETSKYTGSDIEREGNHDDRDKRGRGLMHVRPECVRSVCASHIVESICENRDREKRREPLHALL